MGRVEDECLILVDGASSLKGSIIYCLYNTEVDQYVTDLMFEGRWKKNCMVLVLCHKYEYMSLSLILEEEKYFESIKEYIMKKSSVVKSLSLNPITDSNR